MPDHSPSDFLTARYRSLMPAGELPWNEVIETILAHRSVRAFTNEPVADNVLTQIVACAQSAATSSNLQSWSVVALREPEHKARLAKLCDSQKFILQAPLFLAWCVDLSRARRVAGEPLAGADYLEAFLFSVIDAALAAQNAALAAQSLGLGICYVGALRNHPLEVAKELILPPNVFGVFGMSVGHPDPLKPASVRPRLPQCAVLHFEHYNSGPEAGAVAAYNREQRAFQLEQGMKLADWTARVASRLKDAGALDGRDTLKQTLQSLGFKLR
jgi:nitroreductase